MNRSRPRQRHKSSLVNSLPVWRDWWDRMQCAVPESCGQHVRIDVDRLHERWIDLSLSGPSGLTDEVCSRLAEVGEMIGALRGSQESHSMSDRESLAGLIDRELNVVNDARNVADCRADFISGWTSLCSKMLQTRFVDIAAWEQLSGRLPLSRFHLNTARASLGDEAAFLLHSTRQFLQLATWPAAISSADTRRVRTGLVAMLLTSVAIGTPSPVPVSIPQWDSAAAQSLQGLPKDIAALLALVSGVETVPVSAEHRLTLAQMTAARLWTSDEFDDPRRQPLVTRFVTENPDSPVSHALSILEVINVIESNRYQQFGPRLAAIGSSRWHDIDITALVSDALRKSDLHQKIDDAVPFEDSTDAESTSQDVSGPLRESA